jgi:hypothetical protein
MLQNSKNLESKIYNINNKGYKAYQNFKGAYDFGRYQLFIKAENPLKGGAAISGWEENSLPGGQPYIWLSLRSGCFLGVLC